MFKKLKKGVQASISDKLQQEVFIKKIKENTLNLNKSNESLIEILGWYCLKFDKNLSSQKSISLMNYMILKRPQLNK